MLLRFRFTRIVLFGLIAFSSVLLGCSRPDVVYSGGGNRVKSADDYPINIIGQTLLPRGFFNQSVNRGVVDIFRTDLDSPILRLRTLSGVANTAGGFNGTAIGNRALVGISSYDGSPLTTFDGITLDFIAEYKNPDVLLQVDVDCTGQTPVLFKAAGLSLLPGTELEGGFLRFEALLSANVWTSNVAISDPSDPTVDVITETSSTSLDAFMSAYPNACIRNGATQADDMPNAMPTAGILIGLGDANDTGAHTIWIDRITIGTDVHNDWEVE